MNMFDLRTGSNNIYDTSLEAIFSHGKAYWLTQEYYSWYLPRGQSEKKQGEKYFKWEQYRVSQSSNCPPRDRGDMFLLRHGVSKTLASTRDGTNQRSTFARSVITQLKADMNAKADQFVCFHFKQLGKRRMLFVNGAVDPTGNIKILVRPVAMNLASDCGNASSAHVGGSAGDCVTHHVYNFAVFSDGA